MTIKGFFIYRAYSKLTKTHRFAQLLLYINKIHWLILYVFPSVNRSHWYIVNHECCEMCVENKSPFSFLFFSFSPSYWKAFCPEMLNEHLGEGFAVYTVLHPICPFIISLKVNRSRSVTAETIAIQNERINLKLRLGLIYAAMLSKLQPKETDPIRSYRSD